MKFYLSLLLLFNVPLATIAQKNADGLYLEVEEERCYYSKLKLANTKTTVCVLDNPLIGVEEFVDVGPIEENELLGIRKFSVLMSEEGKKKLAIMSKIYTGKNFAFVLDDEVVCVMEVIGEIKSGKFTVTEKTHHSSLKEVREKLKADYDI
ncbi:hypothetical protein [Reichenbachiella sp.]|uniref:hypothetical protein n=1 Tax=Reichenbachiella sp. TaxID=2184521 RepID=UPI003B59A0B0